MDLSAEAANDVSERLAKRIKALRQEAGLTLEALASRSGVSRSMISLIERGESSPTAAILDRLAGSLGVTLGSLFAASEREDAEPLSRRAEQRLWRDPATGYLRRNLSPPGFPSPIELVEVVLPAGAVVAYDTGPRLSRIGQQIWLIDGRLVLTLGDSVHELGAGDCLAMHLDQPISFRNPGQEAARYIVALGSEAGPGMNPRTRDHLP